MHDLNDYLIQQKILQRAQLQQLLNQQTEWLKAHPGYRTPGIASFAVDNGLCDEPRMVKLLSDTATQPVRSLPKKMQPDASLVDLLGLEYCRKHHVLPLEKRDEIVVLAMSNPHDSAAIDEMRFMLDRELDICFMSANRLAAILPSVASDREVGTARLDESESRIVRVVNTLVSGAISRRASDLHIEAQDGQIEIRYRVDGMLAAVDHDLKSEELSPLVARIKIMAGLDISERRLPQDGRILFAWKDRKIDLRVSIVPSVHGECVVLRVLDHSQTNFNLDTLGLPKSELELLRKQASRHHGLFIVTGPTGSGKTTTLYGILQEQNTPDKKILTIEDPVEYQLAGITQVHARPDIGLGFAHGLRSFLRHDPDVIMVGEIRDQETAEIAIRAALTGHMVFSTLHTNDAPSAITRLVDMGVAPYLVSGTLTMVLAQRLMRKLCAHCRKKVRYTQAQLDELGLGRELKAGSSFYTPVGCDECSGSGYAGRLAVLEILPVDEKLREFIMQDRNPSEYRAMLAKAKHRTLRDNALSRAKSGHTSLAEVVRVTVQD